MATVSTSMSDGDASPTPSSPASSDTPADGPKYPGWGLNLRRHQWYDEESKFIYPIGISIGWNDDVVSMITVREAAMMMAVEELTDKPDWHIKVFDDEISGRWRDEIDRFGGEELDGECADYCIAELRDKAEYFKKSGIVLTLNNDLAIAKSDTLVPPELASALRDAFARLAASDARPDWHPRTNGTVRDLVHPSMYPLVYGRSLFLPDEVVGVDDAIDKWAGKGEIIPRRPEWDDEGGKSKAYWSTTYQWLPANVRFAPDGGVRFTSYVNNLHPTKHRDVYTTLEKLIDFAIPMWDHCLARHSINGQESGPRAPTRVENPGNYLRHRSWYILAPRDPERYEKYQPWDPKSVSDMLEAERAKKAAADKAAADKAAAEMAAAEKDAGEEKEEKEEEEEEEEDDDDDQSETESQVDRWRDSRRTIFPRAASFSPSDYGPREGSSLRTLFQDRGLQIIVKLASIELTPDKPRFDGGNWHVEGQMNERIVGTCLYYLDSENITETSLAFRASTREDEEGNWGVNGDDVTWMEEVFGAELRGGSCLQTYGTVTTPQGRLLAFPNSFHHRVSPFKLVDPTKPGHRRFVALWLVDPYVRIISTANVPPQQAEWYTENAFGKSATAEDPVARLPRDVVQMLAERGVGSAELADALAGGKAGEARLPPELLNMVREALGEWRMMTREEAEGHREKLMEERSAFVDNANDKWESTTYSFCEH